MSTSSEVTITPARWAKESEGQAEWRSPAFMKAFEVDGNEDESDGGLGLDVRGLQECLRREEEEDEEFVMTLGSGA